MSKAKPMQAFQSGQRATLIDENGDKLASVRITAVKWVASHKTWAYATDRTAEGTLVPQKYLMNRQELAPVSFADLLKEVSA